MLVSEHTFFKFKENIVVISSNLSTFQNAIEDLSSDSEELYVNQASVTTALQDKISSDYIERLEENRSSVAVRTLGSVEVVSHGVVRDLPMTMAAKLVPLNNGLTIDKMIQAFQGWEMGPAGPQLIELSYHTYKTPCREDSKFTGEGAEYIQSVGYGLLGATVSQNVTHVAVEDNSVHYWPPSHGEIETLLDEEGAHPSCRNQSSYDRKKVDGEIAYYDDNQSHAAWGVYEYQMNGQKYALILGLIAAVAKSDAHKAIYLERLMSDHANYAKRL